MRNYKNLIGVITFVFALFFTLNGYSQDLLQKEPSDEVRELADERAEMWTKELSLSAKQEDLVEKKIIKYTMRRLEIQDAPITPEEKTELLLAVEKLERGEMRDILTKPQFDRYVLLEQQEGKKGENAEGNSKIKVRQ